MLSFQIFLYGLEIWIQAASKRMKNIQYNFPSVCWLLLDVFQEYSREQNWANYSWNLRHRYKHFFLFILINLINLSIIKNLREGPLYLDKHKQINRTVSGIGGWEVMKHLGIINNMVKSTEIKNKFRQIKCVLGSWVLLVCLLGYVVYVQHFI